VRWAWLALLEQVDSLLGDLAGVVESHQWRAQVRGGPLAADDLLAAGFVHVSRPYWCEARTLALEAGMVAMHARRGSVCIGGTSEAAVRAAAWRLVDVCGPRLEERRYRVRIDERCQFDDAFDDGEEGRNLDVDTYRPTVTESDG
jgi:hypothetical protein